MIVEGVRRVTVPLPFALNHVHCYVLERPDGAFTVVDAGLAADSVERVWGPLLAELGGPVEEIVVTHYHPDHVGGAAALAALAGARVRQAPLDREQSLQWGDDEAPDREAAHLRRHGMPAAEIAAVERAQREMTSRITLADAVEYLEPGDDVGGWEVLLLPGHADAHLALLRDGVLVAGDAILAPTTPNVGLYPETGPDPLGRYLESMRHLTDLAPRVALTGHGEPIGEVAARAQEIVVHHVSRLQAVELLLDVAPLSAYALSIGLFPGPLGPWARHFAVCETLAHLERLIVEGRAQRVGDDEAVRFMAVAG